MSSQILSLGGKRNSHVLIVGLSKDKKSILSVHSTEDFKQTASLELAENLELSCSCKITDTLFMVGGRESIHMFELDVSGTSLKVIELNCFETGDSVQTIVGKGLNFYAVTIKGQINIMRLSLERS